MSNLLALHLKAKNQNEPLVPLATCCPCSSFPVLVFPPHLSGTESSPRLLRQSFSSLCVGRSDGCEDVDGNHNQQVENCGHDTHNAERVLQVHFTPARFAHTSTRH